MDSEQNRVEQVFDQIRRCLHFHFLSGPRRQPPSHEQCLSPKSSVSPLQNLQRLIKPRKLSHLHTFPTFGDLKRLRYFQSTQY